MSKLPSEQTDPVYPRPYIAPHQEQFLQGRPAIEGHAGFRTHYVWSMIKLIRLNKPIGILLLLWPTLWALWLASAGQPDLSLVLIFTAGTVLMRSAGCAINDYADRHVDGQVSRTINRPLVTGELRPKTALITAMVLALVAASLLFFLNSLTVGLALIAVLLASVYPFMKRYTYLPQVVLGAAFAWSVPMAFAAQTEMISGLAWLLFTITLLWTTAYDTVYAMVDRADDLQAGIKSTAILFGEADVTIIMILYALVIAGLIIIGQRLSILESGWQGYAYYAGLSLAGLCFIYQYQLIKNRQPAQCFQAFLNNNLVGFWIFAGIALAYW